MLRKGFTLIELLIVIAIIAILALIAIPNFLESQIRAKVGRVEADMRSLATAMEAYYVDYNAYPFHSYGPIGSTDGDRNSTFELSNPDMDIDSKVHNIGLTTPISYMTTMVRDPFSNKGMHWFGYVGWKDRWLVTSYGPDLGPWKVGDTWNKGDIEEPIDFPEPDAALDPAYNPKGLIWKTYDPTNGTRSGGDIWRASKYEERTQ